jgi:hypothetical protein
MTQISYRYFVRGSWAGPADEKPAVTGAKFLKALDSLSGIDTLLSGWQVMRNWKLTEDEWPRFVPLDAARDRIAEIVEQGVSRDERDQRDPRYGYSVSAAAGARGPRRVEFYARTGQQFFALSFGEHYLASDLTIVTYPLFKAALLAISAAWDAQWSCAQAVRNEFVEHPMGFGPGVPAFIIEAAPQVPLDPTFPRSIFHVPWIVYLSPSLAVGVKLPPEILTESTPDGGLLMTATKERLDLDNPEHARRARMLAETLIKQTGYSSDYGRPVRNA